MWCGIFVHPDGSIMVLYVDDFMLVATWKRAWEHWNELGRHIEFSDPGAELVRYLGAIYRFDAYNPEVHSHPRTIATEMSGYLRNLVLRFQKDYSGVALRKVKTPFPTEKKEWGPEDEEVGKYSGDIASYAASGLFASLVARPDLAVAVQRMCSRVTKRTAADDEKLVRFMAYIAQEHDLELAGTLGPEDLDDLELVVWPDADWNGDPHTTRSTSGLFVELHGKKTGHTFPLTWKVSHQTATSSSSAESETVSASVGIRHAALPIQSLLEAMLGVTIPISCKIDNTQAIAAIKNGYSKKLRHLQRTHRVSIGTLHEIYGDPKIRMEVEYAPSAEHKGDFFTKELDVTAFLTARARVGMRSPSTRTA